MSKNKFKRTNIYKEKPYCLSTDISGVRELLADRLPSRCQGLLTYVSGKPIAGQFIVRRSELGRVMQAFSMFAIGCLVGIKATYFGGLAMIALPFAWILTLAGAREMQLNVMHQASHGNVVSRDFSEYVGRVVSAVLIEMSFPVYTIKHLQHHAVTSSIMDDTVLFLNKYLHIEPGLPSAENLKRFIWYTFSPVFWFRLLKKRLQSQLTSDWKTRFGCLAYLGSVGLYTVTTGQWLGVLLGWAFPLIVLYPIAKSARAIVEHLWLPAEAAGQKRSKEDYISLSFATRCVVMPPAVWTVRTAIRWGVETAFNMLIRWCVLPGESGPAHAWHHDRPRGDWANHIIASAKWEADRVSKGLPPVQEAWGYIAALKLVLTSFEKASKASLTLPGKG